MSTKKVAFQVKDFDVVYARELLTLSSIFWAIMMVSAYLMKGDVNDFILFCYSFFLTVAFMSLQIMRTISSLYSCHRDKDGMIVLQVIKSPMQKGLNRGLDIISGISCIVASVMIGLIWHTFFSYLMMIMLIVMIIMRGYRIYQQGVSTIKIPEDNIQYLE